MAGFCTKCGAPLASTSGFCNACGAPIVAAAPPQPPVAAVPPVYSVPPAPVGYPTQNVYPPPKSSGGALKVILIIVAVVVVLGLAGVAVVGYGAWKVSHAIQVNDNNGKGATVSLPGVGTISAGGTVASDADLGVPAYPGATQQQGGMNMDSAAASMVMAHFTTTDSMSQVVDFYKSKLGDSAVVASSGEGTVINSGADDQNRIMVTIGPGSGDDAGKTTIVVMHTKKKTGA